MNALDISTPLPRLPGATGDDPVIAGFLDEVREAGKVRALISDTSRSVKERLVGLDRLGDRWNERCHGRIN
jgi:hypothetical protein